MKHPSKRGYRNQVRIIGGKWRGRKIPFPPLTELRPTSDRIRETLFNWLQPVILEANCLDIFAGSGVLSLEALSRGAKHVVAVDVNRNVIQHLEQQSVKLQISEALTLYHLSIPEEVLPLSEKFNIVFIDPPFKQSLVGTTCEWLTANNYLADSAYIYLETPSGTLASALFIPNDWQLHRQLTAGQVTVYLYRYVSK